MPTSFDLSQAPSNQTNILINGGMDFWQRNTTFSSPANNVYTADRWKTDLAGSPTYTINRETTIVDVGSLAAFKMQVTTVNGATTCRMQYNVEKLEEYRGKTLTLSARVRSNVATDVKIMLYDGIASPQSTPHSGNSTFETLTVTMTISPTAGRVTAYFGFISSVSVATIYVDNVMLVVGSSPAVYVPKDYGTELAQCQRYYEKTYAIDIAPGTSATNGLVYTPMAAATTAIIQFGSYQFKVTKRVVPNVTAFTTTGASGIQVRDNGSILGTGNLDLSPAGNNGFVFRVTAITGSPVTVSASSNWYTAVAHYVADAEM